MTKLLWVNFLILFWAVGSETPSIKSVRASAQVQFSHWNQSRDYDVPEIFNGAVLILDEQAAWATVTVKLTPEQASAISDFMFLSEEARSKVPKGRRLAGNFLSQHTDTAGKFPTLSFLMANETLLHFLRFTADPKTEILGASAIYSGDRSIVRGESITRRYAPFIPVNEKAPGLRIQIDASTKRNSVSFLDRFQYSFDFSEKNQVYLEAAPIITMPRLSPPSLNLTPPDGRYLLSYVDSKARGRTIPVRARAIVNNYAVISFGPYLQLDSNQPRYWVDRRTLGIPSSIVGYQAAADTFESNPKLTRELTAVFSSQQLGSLGPKKELIELAGGLLCQHIVTAAGGEPLSRTCNLRN